MGSSTYGRLGILWRKFPGVTCHILCIDIAIKHNNNEITLLFALMQYFSRVNAILKTYPTPYVYVIGDHNANILIKNNQSSSKIGEMLLQFCHDDGILMPVYDYLFLSNRTLLPD